MVAPSKKDFLQLILDGTIPPLYEEIPYSPPSLIYESVASTNSFLLESVKGPENIARYSFIGFDPCLIFKVKNGFIEIESSEKNLISGCTKSNMKIPPTPPLLKGGRGGFKKLFSRQKNIFSSKPLNILKDLVKSYKQKPFEN